MNATPHPPHNTTINTELQTLSANTLYHYHQTTQTQNPFTVPNQYFNTLTQHILLQTTQQTLNTQTVPNPHTLPTPFTTPPQYFQKMQNNILEKINALQQTQQQPEPNTTHIPKNNPYTTPQNYFNNLPTQTLHRIHDLETIQNQTFAFANYTPNEIKPFAIPQNYFYTLQQQTLDRIHDQQLLQTQAPTLLTIKNKTPFKTPQNYFQQQQPAKIINPTVKPQTQTKVIPLTPHKNKLTTLLKYTTSIAAAAILFTIGIQYLAPTTTPTDPQIIKAQAGLIPMEEVQKQMASLSPEDIQNYVNANFDDFSDLLEYEIQDADVGNLTLNDFGIQLDENAIDQFLIDEGITEDELIEML